MVGKISPNNHVIDKKGFCRSGIDIWKRHELSAYSFEHFLIRFLDSP